MRRRDVGVLAVTGMAGAAVAQTSGGFQGSGLVGRLEGPTILHGVRVVSNRLENRAGRTGISQHCRTPWGGHPEQWFFKS